MAIQQRYKIIKMPKSKSAKTFLNYLLYGKIRLINKKRQLKRIRTLLRMGYLKEVSSNQDIILRMDSTILN